MSESAFIGYDVDDLDMSAALIYSSREKAEPVALVLDGADGMFIFSYNPAAAVDAILNALPWAPAAKKYTRIEVAKAG
jgi:hypothetical protein